MGDSPGDINIVNAKTDQAAALLNSVRDCWQLMVAYERKPQGEAPRPFALGISENVRRDASEVAARILYDARTGGTPRADPTLESSLQKLALESSLQKLQSGDSKATPNQCFGQMMQATDDLQQGNRTAARENALQAQACYDRIPSKPQQASSGPLLGQVTEITRAEADVLRTKVEAIDWTPFFDALGQKQQKSLEDTYWNDCVPAFGKPEGGFVVQVKAKYGVRRSSASITYAKIDASPTECKGTANILLGDVSVPFSLWPPLSQIDSIRDISVEYSLTFLGSSRKTGSVHPVKADHAYFEIGGVLYHY